MSWKDGQSIPEVIFIKTLCNISHKVHFQVLTKRLKYGLVATGARGRLLKATPTMSLLELEERAEYSGGDV